MEFVVVFCVVFVLIAWWYRRPKNAPPGPRGIPLIGIIPYMTFRLDKTFFEWSKSYGNVMSVRVARSDWVILSGRDTINEALLKQADSFSGRPKKMSKHWLSGGGHGILFTNGNFWKTQRKFGTTTFRDLGVGKRGFEERVTEECNYLLQAISKNENEAYDCTKDVTNAVSNVICNVIFGRRFRYDEQKFIDLSKYDVISDARKAIFMNIAVTMPFLSIFPPFRNVLTEGHETLTEVFNNYQEEFEDHERDLESREPQDFIDAFLNQKMLDKNKTSNFTYKQLKFYIRDMFGAASDTTRNALLWCFLGVLNYPDCQDRIDAEISDIIGNDKTPSMDHRHSMPFTMAYLQEIMRFCTVAPLSVPRRATQNVDIGGYTIPKDAQVMVSIYSVHNDPTVFENAHEFMPDRFLDAEGNFLRSMHVIPFSIGSRNCLGEQLARMELFLFFVSILQRYKLCQDPVSNPPKMEEGKLGFTYASVPYKILFMPR